MRATEHVKQKRYIEEISDKLIIKIYYIRLPIRLFMKYIITLSFLALGCGLRAQQPFIDIDGILKSSKYYLGTNLGLFSDAGVQSSMQTYWGLKLVGNTQQTPQSYTSSNIGSPDDFSVMIPNQQSSKTGLIIRGALGQTGNLVQWQDYSGKTLGVIRADGSLGIGVTNFGSYSLAVNGDIVVKKIRVTQGTSGAWPDYVFDPSYKLPSLDSIEAYISLRRHLPGLPSARTVKEQGLDLADSQAILLKKIEELTLYIIQLNKQVKEQAKALQKYRRSNYSRKRVR
jgi:hypothetical protein